MTSLNQLRELIMKGHFKLGSVVLNNGVAKITKFMHTKYRGLPIVCVEYQKGGEKVHREFYVKLKAKERNWYHRAYQPLILTKKLSDYVEPLKELTRREAWAKYGGL